jgi:hypothetical protein
MIYDYTDCLIDTLRHRVDELEAAIRTHRDYRGHNRCFLDDYELYQVLGDPINLADFVLPPEAEFLACCYDYYRQRQPEIP